MHIRDFNDWLDADRSGLYVNFTRAMPDSIILAMDQNGDTAIVLYPDGTMHVHTSDGEVFGETQLAEPLGLSLYRDLEEGTMTLG